MFPTVRVSFSGPLRFSQPADRYAVLMDIVPTDVRRYRYAYHRSQWLVAGKADPPPPPRLYSHPDSPISVDVLRKQVVSFEKVKLTNNEMDKSGQVSSAHIFSIFFYLRTVRIRLQYHSIECFPLKSQQISAIYFDCEKKTSEASCFLPLNYDRLSLYKLTLQNA